MEIEDLPGGDLIRAGIADIHAGRWTAEALLVAVGAERMRAAGLEVPAVTASWPPEHELYGLLAAEDPDSAHGRYNGLIRRLVSFERALEHARPG